MHSVIFSLSIGTAMINDMRRSMPGVLMTRAISLRSRMRGKLSCPVLKAGRRERSLLPSYQIHGSLVRFWIEVHCRNKHLSRVHRLQIFRWNERLPMWLRMCAQWIGQTEVAPRIEE